MTIKLCECVPTSYEIGSPQDGEIAVTKLVLDKIVCIFCNVNVLKILLKVKKCICLTEIQGMNFFIITNQLHATMVSLGEVGTLPDEAIEMFSLVSSNGAMKASRQSSRIFFLGRVIVVSPHFHLCNLIIVLLQEILLLQKSSTFFNMLIIFTT